jgi:hypothetical protein
MSLRLFDRIATLLTADAHGVVESLEERSLLLKQYLREAELEVNRKRARLEALREEEKRLRAASARREEEVRALDEDVALALGSGKDDLARFAIRRLTAARGAEALAAQIARHERKHGRCGARRGPADGARRAPYSRAGGGPARAGRGGPPGWLVEPVVADEEVELELMRRRDTRGGTS